MVSFPAGFRWGVATAAHQVEGGNWNNDWWAWEHDPSSPCHEPSGDACDHWHRYPDDIALLAKLGFDTYRFSAEWSRIEPEEGEWSRVALDHYRRMCATCRESGVAPILTYHHFTTPRWLAARGGWTRPGAVDAFLRFAERLTAACGDLLDGACTFNEPNVVAIFGHEWGVFPPGLRDADAARRASDVFVDAHRRAVTVLRSGPGEFPVGLTVSMAEWEAVSPEGEAPLAAARRDWEDVFLDGAVGDDFVGVQTYTRYLIGATGMQPWPEGTELTQMGYEFRPEALEATIRRAWEVTGGVPVLVTENGIGTADDDRRVAFVKAALAGVRRCLDDGIDVRGYVHWTLLDNFEWAEGYRPTFGLVAVDRETLQRTPKPSATWLGRVARENALR